MSVREYICQRCGKRWEAIVRSGPSPKYCSRNCRQRAYEDRQVPVWVVHPGEYVKDELEAIGIIKPNGKGHQLGAKLCGITVEEFDALIDCEPDARITPETARRLSAISASAQMWLSLQRRYDEGIARGAKPL